MKYQTPQVILGDASDADVVRLREEMARLYENVAMVHSGDVKSRVVMFQFIECDCTEETECPAGEAVLIYPKEETAR